MPTARLDRVKQMHRRRIDDVIEEAFQHACTTGDLDTAIDLVDLLDRKIARWIAAHGSDGRNGSAQLTRMRAEIVRRQLQRANETSLNGETPLDRR